MDCDGMSTRRWRCRQTPAFSLVSRQSIVAAFVKLFHPVVSRALAIPILLPGGRDLVVLAFPRA